MTAKKMNRILIIVIALLVLGLIIFIVFADKKLASVAHKTVDNREQIEVTDAEIKAYQKTKEIVDSLDYVGELTDEVLPVEQDQSVVVAELSQFALRSNLTVAEINFDAENASKEDKDKKSKSPKGVNVSPITVKLQDGAQFNNLLEFMRLIESNRRTMQITNISLKPSEEDRSLLNEISITMNLYTRSTKTESTESDQ